MLILPRRSRETPLGTDDLARMPSTRLAACARPRAQQRAIQTEEDEDKPLLLRPGTGARRRQEGTTPLTLAVQVTGLGIWLCAKMPGEPYLTCLLDPPSGPASRYIP